LRDIRELSAPEAAAELGISIDALKSRLHRARVNLRDHVARRAEP
jgi:DNA-directed RNA polymerase specialized sigma24 family protein